MKKIILLPLSIILLLSFKSFIMAPEIETITFPSEDGLEITADIYEVDKNAPVIILCHQASWSRGEYREIAPKLNKMGFTCIAIDQRSGNEVNGIKNETATRASEQKLGQAYTDAEQDIVAAVNYAHKKYSKKVILWGSSYSSSLVLKVAKENENVSKVISFSPGEYFRTFSLKEKISGFDKPAFLTSSKNEATSVKVLYDVISSENKTQFIPNGSGEHGSRALWESKKDHKEYWKAITEFLKS